MHAFGTLLAKILYLLELKILLFIVQQLLVSRLLSNSDRIQERMNALVLSRVRIESQFSTAHFSLTWYSWHARGFSYALAPNAPAR